MSNFFYSFEFNFIWFTLTEKAQQASIESFIQEKPPRFVPPDPQTQAGRLQKQTDFLRYN